MSRARAGARQVRRRSTASENRQPGILISYMFKPVTESVGLEAGHHTHHTKKCHASVQTETTPLVTLNEKLSMQWLCRDLALARACRCCNSATVTELKH
ncbi:hypothetical protein BaRGS_00024340 [Batillaria attramentaria]|uniref:Uncharacterized protein n=1 Tax=Batillaria attramentaria TaxID=370345 RepID=A0ABD0KBJ2_9CAEN